MSEFYTPTTEKVRALYVEGAESEEAAGEQFDRWLKLQGPVEPYIRYQNHWINISTLNSEQIAYLRESMAKALPADVSVNDVQRHTWRIAYQAGRDDVVNGTALRPNPFGEPDE